MKPYSEKFEPRIQAALLHAHSGKFYDDVYPYLYHLDMVADKYEWLLFDYTHSEDIDKFAIYFHDTIEDCGLTYNDVRAYAKQYLVSRGWNEVDVIDRISTELADAVFCLTNLRGKTRKERQSDEWYAVLCENPMAVKIKYADKFANLSHSVKTNSSMAGVYRKEWPEFHQKCMSLVTDEGLRDELADTWSRVLRFLEQ
jgi:hypothetical protein